MSFFPSKVIDIYARGSKWTYHSLCVICRTSLVLHMIFFL